MAAKGVGTVYTNGAIERTKKEREREVKQRKDQ